MDEKELRAFVSGADDLSFSVAADRLCISQSALSKRIAHLEESLGAKLFNRVHNRLELTEQGRLFLPHAIATVNSLSNGRAALQQTMNEFGKPLKVGIVNFYALFILPDFLKMFRQMHPDINLSLWYVHQSLSYARLSNHEVDLFITSMGQQHQEGFELVPLWKQEFNIVVNEKHPLAKVKNPSIKQIIKHPVIVPPSHFPTRRMLDKHLLKYGMLIHPQHEVDTMPTLIRLVKQGLGWSVIPSSMVGQDLYRIYRHNELFLDAFLLYNKELKKTEAIETFIAELANACSLG